jgi:3'(2'), 5'-bisphosphate nucleotidase
MPSSLQMPSARRMSAPDRIGVPTSRPNWVSSRESFCLMPMLMPMPMMEKIVHTAKQTGKAIVLAASAWVVSGLGTGSVSATPRLLERDGATGGRSYRTGAPAAAAVMTLRMDDPSLLTLAADLAERAGAIILAVRARGFSTTQKSDASPVTEADHAAEALIVAGLRGATPDIPVVAEEEAAAGHVVAAAEKFWLVDPLDGTREFTVGRDEFTVNIALVRHGRVVLGVVGVPAYGELFGGIVGHGAWRRDARGKQEIHARTAPPQGLTVLASRSHGNQAALNAFLAGRQVAEIVNYGSSLKFCRMAEGKADLYPRHGRTMEWDTAAAQAVLEAAGGAVRTLDHLPLRYGKPGWENPHFYCTGREPSPKEIGGAPGPEPTRYGDWSHKGRVTDF